MPKKGAAMSVKQKFIDLVLRGKDLLSPVTSKATEEFKKLQGETKLAADQLKQLEATQAKLATARGLELYAEQAEKALAGARAEVTRLAREMDLGGKATKEQSESLSAARRSANQLQTEYNKLVNQLTRNKVELEKSGVNTSELATEQDRLKSSVMETSSALSESRERISNLVATQVKFQQEAAESADEAKRFALAVDELGKSAGSSSKKTGEFANSLDKLSNQKQLISEFEQSARALNENETSLNQVAQRLNKLRDEAKNTGAPFIDLARNIDASEQQLSELRKELDKNTFKYKTLQEALKRTGVDTNSLTTEKKRIENQIKRTTSETKKLGEQYNDTNVKQNAFGSSVGAITKRLLAFGAAYIGVNQIKSALTNLFTVGDKFERLDIQLTGVMGSIEAGDQASAWIKDFAKNTPLQLDQVTETFVRLKNFGLDPMGGVMQSIIDQSEKLGGGYERVQGISLALGQAWAKQKLQGEEILQLIERGVPVWQLLENVTGKNTAELQKLSSAGELGRDVMKQLIDEIGRSAEGQAAKGMGTLSGLISNAKDELDQFYGLVANSGALDWLKGQLSELNKTIANMTQSGELKNLAKSISDGVVATGEAIKSLVTTVFEWRKAIVGVGTAWALLKVGTFFSNMLSGSRNLIASLLTLIGTKKAAAAANALYSLSFNGLLAQFAKARAATAAWMASLTGVGALLSRTGIFAGIAYGVYEIGRLTVAWWDLRKAQKELANSQTEAAITQTQLEGELQKVNQQLGANFKSTKDLFDAQEAGLITLNKSTGAWENVDQVIKQHTKTLADYQAVWGTTTDGINAAYETLGIKSTTALKDVANNAENAFKIISSGNEPIEQQRAAFLKYAEAAAAVAKATGDNLPLYIQEQAAALGLSSELAKLTETKVAAKQITELQGKAHSAMQSDILQSKKTIEDYRKVLDSTTASSEQKEAATIALGVAEKDLADKTKALNEVKQLELATYAQLKIKFDEYTRQMEQLDELYRNNGISAAEYLKQKERYVQVLGIIQPMMGGLKDGEKKLKEQTDFANKSLAEQQKILEDLAGTTGKATQYISLLASAQQAINTNFNLTDKSAEQLGARIKELTSFISQNNRVSSVWWRDLAVASNEAFRREQQIISETLLIREYTKQLASSSATLADVARISKAANYSFNQLGDNELAPLRNAIADAEKRILTLRDGLQGTLRGLQDELDRLQNNQSQIDKRNYDAQVLELRAKLKDAQAGGDLQSVKAAEQALALAKQIYDIKTQQQKVEAQAANAANSKNAGAAAPDNKPRFASEVPVLPKNAIISTSTPSQTVRLELAMPSGRAFSAQMAQTDASALLAEIERTRSTSL